MARAKILLGDFDFNDGVNTRIADGFKIPAPKLTAAGERKRRRGIRPGSGDYEPLIISIPFFLKAPDGDKADLAALAATLNAELQAERNTLTYNPDPDTTLEDVYFETYLSFTEPVFDKVFELGARQSHVVELLADPYAAKDDRTLFDSTMTIFTGDAADDGVSEVWTGTFQDTNQIAWGTNSRKILGASGSSSATCDRVGGYALDFTPYLAAGDNEGWVSLWIYRDGPEYTDEYVTVRLGSDSSNYRQWTIGRATDNWQAYGGHGQGAFCFVRGWQVIFFDFNDPDTVAGAPNLAAIDHFKYQTDRTPGNTTPTVYIDNCTISNGKILAPQARAPFICTAYDIDTTAPATFKARISNAATADRLWIGKGKTGMDNPPVIIDRQISAVAGFFDTSYTVGGSLTHDGYGAFYNPVDSVIKNVEKKIFPGRLIYEKAAGLYKVFARVQSKDTGGVAIRWAGFDGPSNTWGYGETKTIYGTASSPPWQIVNLGDVSLPLIGFSPDADPAVVYTNLGLSVTGSSSTAKDFCVDYILLLPFDGGGLCVILPVANYEILIDTGNGGDPVCECAGGGDPQYAASLRNGYTGDLEFLLPGKNNLVLHAFNSASPDNVSQVALKYLKYTPRVLWQG